jgi:hypothetical protein
LILFGLFAHFLGCEAKKHRVFYFAAPVSWAAGDAGIFDRGVGPAELCARFLSID